jgi:exopolysaccharide biosynthesis operon protein EpsL
MSSSRLRPFALVVGAMCSTAAAAPADVLQVVAGVGFAHDDNLLRIPEGEPAFDDTFGDSWVQTEVGLILDKPYKRQRFAATARLSKYQFDHFDQLDYNGKDLQTTWHWQLGNRLEGKAGATYVQELAPYTDVRSNERNLRQQRRQFVDATYSLHPRWRARAALASEKFTYDLASQIFNDRTENTGELEANYLAGTGSSVGLVLRKIEGKYAHGRPVGPLIVEDDFTQDEVKARIRWLASGITTVEALAGWARRKQSSLDDGSTSGVNGRISAEHTPRGKIKYNAALWRDFAPVESTNVSYSLNNGASIGATWEPRARVKLEAEAIYERRKYNARFALPGTGDPNDALRTANVRATWSPRQSVQVTASYAYQARTASEVLDQGKFRSNSVSFNVSAQF